MEASLALRRHFCSRSAQLITPLARYLNTLIPSPTEVQHARKASTFQTSSSTPHSSLPTPAPTPQSTPRIPIPSITVPTISSALPYTHNHQRLLRLKPFNNTNFFASLKAHGSILPFKSTSKRTEFYERWVLCSTSVMID